MYVMDFAKNLFRKSNIGVIIYLVLNIMLYIALLGGFSNVGMVGVGLLLYLITLCIALSPVGEFIMRLQNGCRKIKRRDYLERLTPLFEEVYVKAKVKNPTISDNVQLFMSGSKSPNAFATGRRTICITKGFLTYTDEQIKGTLAHEFAHLANKDTDLLLLISVGNLLMSAVFLIWRIIANNIVSFFTSVLRMSFLGSLLTSLLIDMILVFLMSLWTRLGMLLVMHSSRQNEFEADAFAFELGYGDDLCAVLDSFDDGDASEKRSLWAQLRSTHPSVDDRIARLQDMGAGYMNMYGQNLQTINANPKMVGYTHTTPLPIPPIGGGHQTPVTTGNNPLLPIGAAALVDSAKARTHSVTKPEDRLPDDYDTDYVFAYRPEDGFFYPAKITSGEGGAVTVLFLDGKRRQASFDELVRFGAMMTMRVESDWERRGDYHPCKLYRKDGDRLEVVYDADGVTEDVAMGQLRLRY